MKTYTGCEERIPQGSLPTPSLAIVLLPIVRAQVLGRPVVSDSLEPHRLWAVRLLCPCDSPGKNTGVLLCPPPEDLPDPEIEPESPASVSCIAGGFFATDPPLPRNQC